MFDAKVDKETRYTHLGNDLVTVLLEDGSHGKLEVVHGLVQAVIGLLQDAGARENQILLQGTDTPRTVGGGLNTFGIERTEDDGALLGTGKKDVKAAMTAGAGGCVDGCSPRGSTRTTSAWCRAP